MGRISFHDSKNECLENSGRVAAYNFNDDKLRAAAARPEPFFKKLFSAEVRFYAHK